MSMFSHSDYLIGQKFVRQKFRRLAKFSSLLSANMLITIVLGKLFGQNYSSDKTFVEQKFRHLAKISSVSSDKVLSNEVVIRL